MRKLDVSAITAAIGLPVKSGTLSHVQLAYQEALGEIVKAITGYGYDPTKVYVLNGCVNSGSGSNYVISAGSVFFNGEVFLVDATSFTISGPNVAVGIKTLTYFTATNADPVQFTDGATRTIHQIWKIVPQAGLSGSGAADYANWVQMSLNIPKVNLTGTGLADVTGTYPNINVDVTLPPSGVLASGVLNIGDISSSGTNMNVVFGTAIATNNYIVTGGIISAGSNMFIDTTVVWTWKNPTVGGFNIEFAETQPQVQNVKFGWAVIAL